MNNSLLKATAQKVSYDDKNLKILWKDGTECDLDLLTLRKYCPCVECRGGHDNDSIRTTEGITQIGVQMTKNVGRYALQIIWSDNHDEGMYTWDGLRKSCDEGKPYGYVE
ncbi:MAG: DUF971 domain-containing protein [Spirochaetia bacterium]|nr:DUF971 domain-containing protein [Spirochaetia bacterium]